VEVAPGFWLLQKVNFPPRDFPDVVAELINQQDEA